MVKVAVESLKTSLSNNIELNDFVLLPPSFVSPPNFDADSVSMRLSKLHALLLLPPTLLLTAWFFSSSSSSTSTVPPSPGRSPSPLSFLQLDEDLSLLYRQLKLPKPVRVYPPELSDQQKRRFHGLRAPTATSSSSKREGQARRRYEEASEQLLGSRDDDEEEKDEQDQLYYLTSNLLNASPVLVSLSISRSSSNLLSPPSSSLIFSLSLLFSFPARHHHLPPRSRRLPRSQTRLPLHRRRSLQRLYEHHPQRDPQTSSASTRSPRGSDLD